MSIKNTLWILSFVFVAPVLFGGAFYFFAPHFFTNKTLNYGELIEPAIIINIDDIKNQTKFKQKWTLVYKNKTCARMCLEILEEMKTIHLLANDKIKRIQRLFISESDIPKGTKRIIQQQDTLYYRNKKKFSKFAHFPENSLFLMDPLGNVILRYDTNMLDIKAVVKDLERLLKYSYIG